MTDTVYDFSGAHLTDLPGAVGAMLYMGTPGRHKNATPSQVAALLAGGYQVGGVFENNTLDWAQGRDGGRRFAADFDMDATNCGLAGVPGAFTADNPAAKPGQFVEMLRGANDVIGVARTSAYGYLPHLIAARNAGVATRFWLTGHCPDPMPPWIDLYQHNGSQPAEWGPATSTVGGITVDHNTALHADWGQHSPQPAPPPVPLKELIAMQNGSLFYAKGKDDPGTYLVKIDYEVGLTRRYVTEAELTIALQAGKETVAVLDQAEFDAIPKIKGSP
jgi:hypothetical protein